MGKIVVRREWVETQSLQLTFEDYKLREERRQRKDSIRFPQETGMQKRFAEHLLKCPYCGKAPKLLTSGLIDNDWNMDFDYKFDHSFCGSAGFGCGCWYKSLAKAGKSWNDRVRREIKWMNEQKQNGGDKNE